MWAYEGVITESILAINLSSHIAIMDESHKHVRSNPVIAYFRSAFEEFGKITWPTKEQAAILTAIVIGVSLVAAMIIGAFDLGLSELYEWALQKLSV